MSMQEFQQTIREGSQSIAEFCRTEGISGQKYRDLRQRGLGPKEMRDGSWVRISPEARAEWRAMMANRAPEDLAEQKEKLIERAKHASAVSITSPLHISKLKQRKRA